MSLRRDLHLLPDFNPAAGKIESGATEQSLPVFAQCKEVKLVLEVDRRREDPWRTRAGGELGL